MTSPSPRKNVLVLGMPRSGTSATASIFAAAGYFLGEVRPADDANPLGYFQSEELTALNADLFRRVGFPHHNTWLHDPITAEQIARIATLEPEPRHQEFLARFQAHAPWAWKDPRLCLTLGFWLKLLDPATTVMVLVRRDPADIYHSFRRRNWIKDGRPTRREVYRRAEQHIAVARDTLQRSGCRWIEVWYPDLLDRTEEVLARINDLAGTDLRPEHLTIVRDLDHSRGRAKASWYAVRVATRVRPLLALVKRVVPRSWLLRLFPERKYLGDAAPATRRIGRT